MRKCRKKKLNGEEENEFVNNITHEKEITEDWKVGIIMPIYRVSFCVVQYGDSGN